MTNARAWKSWLSVLLLVGLLASPAVRAAPVLSIAATPDPAQAGSSVTLDFQISGVTDLYAYQYTLSFDPSLLQAVSVSEGPFLASGGPTFFGAGTIDNALGTISFIFDTLTGPLGGVSGDGILGHIQFEATQGGVSALNFSNVVFLDSTLADIAVVAQDRQLTILAVPEPVSVTLVGVGLVALAVSRWRRMAA